MVKSIADSVDTDELDALMREFPDWKEQFPDIARELNPPRYHKHARGNAQASDNRVVQKRSQTVPVTDYQDRFGLKHSRPRSTKRPPPTPRDPCPPPMNFATNQRIEYTPKDIGGRVKPIVREDNYEPPTEPFEGKSSYSKDFPGGYKLPELKMSQGFINQSTYKQPGGRFDSRTTNQEHYKKWVPQPSLQFGELPSFTGSILYPDKSMELETTTGATFQGKPGKRSDPFKLTDAKDLKIQGVMDLNTTNRSTFKGYEGAMPAKVTSLKPEVRITKRDKFSSNTQSQLDFPGYKYGQPMPPKPVTPPPSTIDLRYDNRTSFVTEQRNQFAGVDAAKHPPPKSLKKDIQTYIPPTVKFETMSHSHNDFRPIDMNEAYKAPVRMPVTRVANSLPKFDSTTSNKEFFKKWDVHPRPRYSDFHESHTYVPPPDPFTAKSTNQLTYVPKSAPIPESFKPEEKPIENTGVQDFRSVHKLAFPSPKVAERLTRAQKKTLLKELRRRKHLEDQFQTQGFEARVSGQAISAN